MVKYILPACLTAFIALACIFFVHISVVASDVATPTIQPDLAFIYTCAPADDLARDDRRIDLFLKDQGFQVQDVGELDGELGITTPPLQEIAAVDRQLSVVNISQTADDRVDHQVVLYEEPPTTVPSAMGDALLAFFVNSLGCKASYVNRAENPASAKNRYDEMFSSTQAQIFQFHDEKFLPAPVANKPAVSSAKSVGP